MDAQELEQRIEDDRKNNADDQIANDFLFAFGGLENNRNGAQSSSRADEKTDGSQAGDPQNQKAQEDDTVLCLLRGKRPQLCLIFGIAAPLNAFQQDFESGED